MFAFDSREIVVLKVVTSLTVVCNTQSPNRILNANDVPLRHNRNVPDDVKHPADSPYTLQRPASNIVMQAVPNNGATILSRTELG